MAAGSGVQMKGRGHYGHIHVVKTYQIFKNNIEFWLGVQILGRCQYDHIVKMCVKTFFSTLEIFEKN